MNIINIDRTHICAMQLVLCFLVSIRTAPSCTWACVLTVGLLVDEM